MPQFDKITFFNQIFWLFVFFFGFYFIFLKIFLPKLSSILKARTKKLQKGSFGVTFFAKEQDNVIISYNNSIEQTSSVIKIFVSNSSTNLAVWLESSIKSLNKETLDSSNKSIEILLHKQTATTYLLSNLIK